MMKGIMTPIKYNKQFTYPIEPRNIERSYVSKIKEEINFFFKIPEFKIFQQIKQIYLPYLFTFRMSSLVLVF